MGQQNSVKYDLGQRFLKVKFFIQFKIIFFAKKYRKLSGLAVSANEDNDFTK